MSLKKYIIPLIFPLPIMSFDSNCVLPKNISDLDGKLTISTLYKKADIRRNSNELQNICMHSITFQEGKYLWKMALIYNPIKKSGPFWFLPHDDEDTAFDSAVYAVNKYGGGLLAINSSDYRLYNGQDPNRNFSNTQEEAQVCSQQNFPAPLYSKNVFKIIDAFRSSGMPYLSIHNNKDGWSGNGGIGKISILQSSPSVKSYPSGKVKVGKRMGIEDEDSLVYIAGVSTSPDSHKLDSLVKSGMHTKYEVVNQNNNDCSMSNYVVLNKHKDYYNLETEHGDIVAQKTMIDKLMKKLNIIPLNKK